MEYIIEGDKTGPVVTIIGALHGNEQVGVQIIEALKKELSVSDVFGTLQLLLGNPKAYNANQRYIDYDLNRLFGEALPEAVDKNAYELGRMRELKPYLEKTDFLLDIHATGKPSVPFVYCESDSQHIALAQLIDTDYIISPNSDFRPVDNVSATDNCVDRNGGVGITYEAGWCEAEESFEMVYEKVLRFLGTVGVLGKPFQPPLQKGGAEQISLFTDIRPATQEFTFVQDWKNFDVVKEGNVIAVDNGNEAVASEDVVLIFPKKTFVVGKTAVFLGRII